MSCQKLAACLILLLTNLLYRVIAVVRDNGRTMVDDCGKDTSAIQPMRGFQRVEEIVTVAPIL